MQDKLPKKTTSYSLLFKATNRTVVFVAAWLAAVFAFFLLAQFRRFLDVNMFFLIRVLAVVSIALLVMLCFEFVQIIFYSIWYKKIKCLAAFGIFFPAAIIAAVVLAVTLSIEYVSEGI
jgi:hypothetical protein